MKAYRFLSSLRYTAALALLLFATALRVVAQSSNKIYRVTSDATAASGTGQSWAADDVMPLAAALAAAQAGDEIWVKRGTYRAPEGGFVLRSGVKMYGGLAGSETTHTAAAAPKTNARRYDLANPTVLTADASADDNAPADLLIFPENPTRDDNRRHVLTVNIGVSDDHRNDNSERTVVQGFVIIGGSASAGRDTDGGHGGGILVTNSSQYAGDANAARRSFEISQCYFAANYGARGGALYVDPSVKSAGRIRYCGFFNNAAGSRTANVNSGAAMWLAGAATVSNCAIYNNAGGGVRLSAASKIVNCTIVHNTISAVDLTDDAPVGTLAADGGGALFNTVLWGSSSLCKNETRPQFRACAYPEADEPNSEANRHISYTNFTMTESAAWFDTPSSSVGYDRTYAATSAAPPEYSFTFSEESALMGAGNIDYYRSYVSSDISADTDLGGNPRHSGGSSIDIGAYERVVLPEGRRLYVSMDGKDSNTGLSWDEALANPQTAIDKLAQQTGRGEVWIAEGVYSPKAYINGSDSKLLAFQMKDGISVYGGFAGNETRAAQRERGTYPWDFKHPTILRGDKFDPKNALWNASEEEWSVSSDSYHVVWLAPLPNEMFLLQTVLNGVTVEGGSASEGANAEYAPYQGAGIYMNGEYTQVRNCIVRYNNAGMKETVLNGTSYHPQGGGIYCQGGQVRYSLVYNNTAEQGGGVYLSTYGFVNNSMIANNSAVSGAGVYLWEDPAWGEWLDYKQILATSVITNNQSTRNGAVYADGSGLVEQNTIANNYTSNVTDLSDPDNTSRTAGLYITGSCIAVNNLLWNNTLMQNTSGVSKKYSSSLAPIYAASPRRDRVMFFNNAMSDVNAATWNGIYQTGTYELTAHEFQLGTDGQYADDSDFADLSGVQSEWTDIRYMWTTRPGSVLRNKGMLYGQLPVSVLFKPCTDFLERNFESRPPVGAYISAAPSFVFDRTTRPGTLRLYLDRSGSVAGGNGSSWQQNASSLSEMLDYIATLKVGSRVSAMSATGNAASYTIKSTDRFEICSREGVIQPATPYTFQESDAKSRTVRVQPTCLPLTISGGYPAYATKAEPADADRRPLDYRTEFTGNADGSDLSDGLYHVFRVETGANVTLDGVALTNGYAAGTAYVPYGGAMLIGSLSAADTPTKVTLRNTIIENNTAIYGAAVGAMPDARNVSVTMENCVVNNNSCLSEDISNVGDASVRAMPRRAAGTLKSRGSIIELGDASNTLTLRHVTMVNNVGIAPGDMGASSFAAGNQTYDAGDNLTAEGAGNTLTLATLDSQGAANFANPTKAIGSHINGNVYYGGYSSFRPLTGALANDAIINRVMAGETLDADIAGQQRNLGGAPDLGAYEALLPKAGKVIYVRSYNTDWRADDCIDGTPDFALLNEHPANIYDGRTWGRAIMGNAVCDMTVEWGSDNTFYVRETDGRLVAATVDETRYSADASSGAVYGRSSGAYGAFFAGGTTGASNGNQTGLWSAQYGTYNKITNNRDERYVSGLQYAVEQAAKWNAAHPADSMVVWVGAGVYTDYKGFVIRNGVKVYGGFCKDGNPGEDDRRPLLSQYVPARKGYESLKKSDYETILQIRKETPVYMTNSSKELWWSENKAWDGSKYDFIDKLISSGKTERHYVLYQPDVCLPTWAILGDDRQGSRVSSNQYRYTGFGNYDDPDNYQGYTGVKWDGFSIRHGYIANYSANRDGGGGVRVFRGIELENLIIVNNVCHGTRSRGGGLYMDGDNSTISNSFLLRNLVWGSKDCYGGGAYMIQGVGYNMVVASNRSLSQGGGIFIESAKFYNNTVAYNMANNVQGTGIMHWQDNTTGISSQLTLYNCLVYDNMRNNGITSGTTQIGSSSAGLFQRSYNCYVNSDMGNLASKFKAEDGNVTGASIAFPFTNNRYGADGSAATGDIRNRTARLTCDFRLNEADGLAGNPCLNGGTEDMPSIPATDMDYTNRIKDCTIDIGAYEADNTANITPQTRTRSASAATAGETYYVYYVTQTGAGNRSGSDPDNAACAEKLQSVLTAAGKWAYDHDFQNRVYVKVAGYPTDENGERFVYHANTLADPSDPQSYTFLIPEGVWLMGGYNEGTTVGGKYDPATYNWDDDARDVITDYQTILSARTEPKEGSTVTQEVYGYHVVSFGKWPKGDVNDYYKHAVPGKPKLTSTGAYIIENGDTVRYHGTAGIDGVRLVDGRATDNSGFSGKGGAAVVPAYAHVRNCAITDCQAIDGGALYVLPGSIVSGTLIHSNKAQNGGAIYASGGYQDDPRTQTYRAYVASCTIAGNEATVGGGIYQELGAVFVGNTVVWGNSATTDKNISGVVDETFNDNIHHVPGDTTIVDYYPYNACFVERYKLPGNMENTSMESDLETYFASTGEYYPRPYSQLIDNGVPKAYFQLWRQLGVAQYDMKGVERGLKDRLTVGAYAMTLPEVDSATLLTRVFVSAEGGAEVATELKAKYIGRSFLTPFNSLDAALSYIKQARKTGLATDATHFEIIVAGGTYKPSIAREDKDIVQGQVVIDRRLQSFVIPVNVNIYGSFSNEDAYSSTPVDADGSVIESEKLREIEDVAGRTWTLTPDRDIRLLLEERNRDHMTDMNKNKLIEPWEFKTPTILSGDIKASEKEKRVYHVVYSRIDDSDATSAAKNNDVLLDGITIMNGQTADEVDEDDDDTEPGISAASGENYNDIGHGGGIYSRNVSYTLNRCRILRNVGVHGGGIYIYNGSLDIIGSAVSGNWAGSESESMGAGSGKGGGVCATFSDSHMGNVHAVNSLFANNTAGSGSQHLGGGEGGAIYVKRLAQSDPSYRDLAIVNCLIVRNYAAGGPDVFLEPNISSEEEADADNPLLINTVCWGNQSTRNKRNMYLYDTQMSHCALDIRGRLNGDPSRAASTNIMLDSENMTVSGPRFTKPSTAAGNDNFDIGAQWNPASISVLTDAGDGVLAKTVARYDMSKATGAYRDWWAMHDARLPQYGYPDEYITRATEAQSADLPRAEEPYRRYMGPVDNEGNADDRTIDIGLYEFQYVISFAEREAVYIGTEERGRADGSSWDDRSTDLRGAIIAMANPKGNSSTGTATQAKRYVYVESGEYYSPSLTGGNAFSLIVNRGDMANLVTGVEIQGACRAIEKVVNGQKVQERDFSKPTVIVPNPLLSADTKVNSLMEIAANGRPVTLSGLTFSNTHQYAGTGTDRGGMGVTASVSSAAAFGDARLTLYNCALRGNLGTAMDITDNDGEVLIYNTLFADGAADALKAAGTTRVLNATFAKNGGADCITAEDGHTDIYNTVAWNNATQNITTDADRSNCAFAAGQANDDVMAGPNFTDPDNADYTLRPSFALLDKGQNRWYTQLTGVSESKLTAAASDERELANQRRCTGGTVDIGAYECDSKLLPIIYVKTGLPTAGTGESWDSPTTSVQSAVNLAELYANTGNKSKSAYVFVDRNSTAQNLNITLPGVKVYGSMEGNEISTLHENSSALEASEVKAVVDDLLAQRDGTIAQARMTTVDGLSIDYSLGTAGSQQSTEPSVVDGFGVTGSVSLRDGYLSTSVLDAGTQLTGSAAGTLYNSLAYGSVGGVRTVNVTATSPLPDVEGSANNRPAATEQNLYVKDTHWQWQLNDKSNDIDGGTDNAATERCIAAVGHRRDLAGNLRLSDGTLRPADTRVDNGCFETWHLAQTYAATPADYPHGKSVIYVDGERGVPGQPGEYEFYELRLDESLADGRIFTKSSPFSPGFLLLGHHAGLRGNGVEVSLQNFAVERHLKVGNFDMCAIPFTAVNRQLYVDGVLQTDVSVQDGKAKNYYSEYSYSGTARAAYDYTWDSVNSSAWVSGAAASQHRTDGMMIRVLSTEATEQTDIVLRYYGNSYTEGSSPSSVILTQYNNQQAWSDSSDGGLRFTHKENMGWNLFGSPYLCAMNYSDMLYPRMLYVNRTMYPGGGYPSVNTEETAEGYIPACDAVFTQTATLRLEEQFAVAHSSDTYGAPYQLAPSLALAIGGGDAAAQTACWDDEVQLNAVDSASARSYFDMSLDGVKWMDGSRAQIYAVDGASRYALLSAVSRDGETRVGIAVPRDGTYTVGIPGSADTSGYDAVMLTDGSTGTVTNLLDGDYTFGAAAGEDNARFTVSFSSKAGGSADGMRIGRDGAGRICAAGLLPGDDVRVYGADGKMAAHGRAVSGTLCIDAPTVCGMAIVEVARGGKTVCTRKIK